MLAEKWALLVVHTLANGPARTSQLRRQVGGISEKMLIQTLRRLERNGFVSRRAFPEVPPRVEYSLTALGASLSEPITTLDRWVENHLQDIAMAQREFDRHDG
jgi:DNA-binding HxlR family transcriptional regulator